MDETLLKLNTVLDRVGFGSSTVRDWVAEGTFPQPIRVNGKSPRWLKSEVDEWIAGQIKHDRETV